MAKREQVTEALVVQLCRCGVSVVAGGDDATWVLCGVDVSTTSARESFENMEKRWGCRHMRGHPAPSTTQPSPDRAWEKNERDGEGRYGYIDGDGKQ